MTLRNDMLEVIRGARALVESEALAGVDAAPWRLDPPAPVTRSRPFSAPAPKEPVESPRPAATPPAWPDDKPRPSRDPSRAPEPLSAEGKRKQRLLEALEDEMGDCDRCKLCQGRTRLVFGVGNPDAALMLVGDSPGRDEDEAGEPFVGAAGHVLTRMLTNVLELSRRDVYVAYAAKCRPPLSRAPAPDEWGTCRPFLVRQIGIIQPRIVLALGAAAAQAVLSGRQDIARLRGQFVEAFGALVMPTYHPSFLMRHADQKRNAWEDLKRVKAKLDELAGRPRQGQVT